MTNNIGFALNGLFSAPRNLLYRTINRPLKPKCLVVMTTDKCNSRCLHCNIWKQENTADPITPEEIGMALLSPVFDNVTEIINTGGECTLRTDLQDILIAEHEALPKAKLQISTNGLLPERVVNIVNNLKEKKICLNVGISLDGIGDAHDEIRGIWGSFLKTDKLIKWLQDEKLSVGFVLSDATLFNLTPVYEYLSQYGIKPFVQWCNDGNFYGNDANINRHNSAMRIIVESLEPKMLGNLLIKNKWLQWLDNKPIAFPCFALHTFCVLKCNGDIVPCLSMFDSVIGNIRKDKIEDIWYGKEATYVRKKIKGCQGCLNSWGAGWSFYSAFYPYAQYLKNPKELIRGLINED